MRCKRALVSPSETITRHEQVRVHTAKKRAPESPSETMARLEHVQAHTAEKRALESPNETMARLEKDRAHTTEKRALPIAIHNMIANFQSKIKMDPDFVCTVCHKKF